MDFTPSKCFLFSILFYFHFRNSTYAIVGDGESAEGSIWESLHFASYYNLDNLCVIFDVNRLGQSEPTSLQHNMEVYRKRLDGFGFNAIVVDGHDIEELCKAFHEANVTKDKPTAIIAKTFKGKFFPNIEDADNWHGKPLGENADSVIKYLNSLVQNKGALQIAPLKPLKGNCFCVYFDLCPTFPTSYNFFSIFLFIKMMLYRYILPAFACPHHPNINLAIRLPLVWHTEQVWLKLLRTMDV